MSESSIHQQAERSRIFFVSVTVGVVMGVIQSIIWVVSGPLIPGGSSYRPTPTPPSSTSLTTFLALVTPIIWVIAFLILAIWAGKATGRVGQGTLSGLFAGLFGGIVAAIGNVLVMTLNMSGTTNPYGPPALASWLAIGLLIYILMLTVGGGAGLGALGGLIGQYLSPVRPQPKNGMGTPPVRPPYMPPQHVPPYPAYTPPPARAQEYIPPQPPVPPAPQE